MWTWDSPGTPVGDCAWYADIDMQSNARASAFFGGYIPALVAVACLSTPRLRKQWAFWILFFALAISLGRGMMEMQLGVVDVNQMTTDDWVAGPLYFHIFYAMNFLQWYTPWICDCALLCKLLAFHTASTTSWKRRAIIISFPLAMHLPRVPLLGAASVLPFTAVIDRGVIPAQAYLILIIEGAFQVAENFFCSGFLLYKARQFAQADYAAFSHGAQRVRLKLRYFTESILFTFLPASILQIAWLSVAIVSFRWPDPTGRLLRADAYLRLFNASFSVNFGLLAVWWASARIHALEAGQVNAHLQSDTERKHDAAQDMSLLEWALGPIELEERSIMTDGSDRMDHRDSLVDEPKSVSAEEEDEMEDASLRRRRQSTS